MNQFADGFFQQIRVYFRRDGIETLLRKDIGGGSSYWLIALVVIFMIGLDLRVQMVNQTLVQTPIRADARDYYAYAYNLRMKNVYSRSVAALANPDAEVKPDAVRSPGYPLFLALFVDGRPSKEMLRSIVFAQAFLSALLVFLVYFALTPVVARPWALLAAGLVAISPHLVAANAYLLSETLYSVFLVLLLFVMRRQERWRQKKWILLAGMVVAAGALVRPTLQYFPLFLIPFLFLVFERRVALKSAAFLLAGFFLVYAPWAARNLADFGSVSKSNLAVLSVRNGMNVGLMYKNRPETYGRPYAFDPEWQQKKTMGEVVSEIASRFRHEPLTYLSWYLIGKPRVLLSWSIANGAGDVFIYSVYTSPYFTLARFKLTHALMKFIHWPLMIAGLLGMVLAWLPRRMLPLSPESTWVIRLWAILFGYHLLVHIAGGTLPRYSIPLRPEIFGLAAFAMMVAWRRAREYLPPQLARAEIGQGPARPESVE